MTDTEIQALPLTVRAKAVLKIARAKGLDAFEMTREEIMEIPNIGRKTANEIFDYARGLSPPPPSSPLVQQIRQVIIALDALVDALEAEKDSRAKGG